MKLCRHGFDLVPRADQNRLQDAHFSGLHGTPERIFVAGVRHGRGNRSHALQRAIRRSYFSCLRSMISLFSMPFKLGWGSQWVFAG
jgi:hypothetical protein